MPCHTTPRAALQVCGEYKIHNCDIEMRGDHTVDDLVDVIEGNRIYIPALYILNKIDQITLEELEVIDRMENYVPICAYHEWNLDGVLEYVWDKLELVRCAANLQLVGGPKLLLISGSVCLHVHVPSRFPVAVCRAKRLGNEHKECPRQCTAARRMQMHQPKSVYHCCLP